MPKYPVEIDDVGEMLFAFAEETGSMSGVVKALPKPIQNEAIIDICRTNR